MLNSGGGGVGSPIFQVIGFEGSQDNSETPSISITGNYVVDLRGLSKVFIHVSFVNNHFITESGEGSNNPLGEDVLIGVDMVAPFGGTVVYTNTEDDLLGFNLQNRNISRFRVYLTDEDNNPIDTYGFDWSLTLVVVQYDI